MSTLWTFEGRLDGENIYPTGRGMSQVILRAEADTCHFISDHNAHLKVAVVNKGETSLFNATARILAEGASAARPWFTADTVHRFGLIPPGETQIPVTISLNAFGNELRERFANTPNSLHITLSWSDTEEAGAATDQADCTRRQVVYAFNTTNSALWNDRSTLDWLPHNRAPGLLDWLFNWSFPMMILLVGRQGTGKSAVVSTTINALDHNPYATLANHVPQGNQPGHGTTVVAPYEMPRRKGEWRTTLVDTIGLLESAGEDFARFARSIIDIAVVVLGEQDRGAVLSAFWRMLAFLRLYLLGRPRAEVVVSCLDYVAIASLDQDGMREALAPYGALGADLRQNKIAQVMNLTRVDEGMTPEELAEFQNNSLSPPARLREVQTKVTSLTGCRTIYSASYTAHHVARSTAIDRLAQYNFAVVTKQTYVKPFSAVALLIATVLTVLSSVLLVRLPSVLNHTVAMLPSVPEPLVKFGARLVESYDLLLAMVALVACYHLALRMLR